MVKTYWAASQKVALWIDVDIMAAMSRLDVGGHKLPNMLQVVAYVRAAGAAAQDQGSALRYTRKECG